MSLTVALTWIAATAVGGVVAQHLLYRYEMGKLDLEVPDWVTEEEDDDGWGNSGNWGDHE